MTDEVKLLSDDEVAELEQASDNLQIAEAAYSADRSEWHGRHVARLRFDEVVTFARVSTLCATVRALRERIDGLNTLGEEMLTRLEKVTGIGKKADHGWYFVVGEVERQYTALREQLAQREQEWKAFENLGKRVEKDLRDQLAQVTRERSDLQDALRRFETIQSQPSDII